MSSADQPLPEGTDHIIEGAGVSIDDDVPLAEDLYDDEPAPSGSAKPASGEGADNDNYGAAFLGRFDDLKGQATDKARDLAQGAKDRATAALDDLVKMIEDAAAEVDSKLGSQYGDYARRAADGIGGFSEAFKDKDVDQIFDQARELVKKSPQVAMGVSAALGFVIARVVRSGIAEKPASSSDGGNDSSVS